MFLSKIIRKLLPNPVDDEALDSGPGLALAHPNARGAGGEVQAEAHFNSLACPAAELDRNETEKSMQ